MNAFLDPSLAEGVVRHRARRLVVAGLAMSIVFAGAAALRAILESPPELIWRRAVASGLVVAVACGALALHHRFVPALERDRRWLFAWCAVVVVAFALDGPGDELLLPAALGPVGVAGLIRRPRDALLCAVFVDAGYIGELALHGDLLCGHGGSLDRVAANCAFVLLTAAVIALPVRLALGISENVAQVVDQWRLDPGGAPRVIRAARYRALGPGSLLSDRERRIVAMIGRGMYYAAIGAEERRVSGRRCSERTVRKVVAGIKRKTGAETRAELVALVAPREPLR